MNWKKEFKKRERSFVAKRKKVTKRIKKYIRKQKLTRGDLVFATTMVVVALLVSGIIGRFTVEIFRPAGGRVGSKMYVIDEARKPNPSLRALVLGVKNTEARSVLAAYTPRPEYLKINILMYHRISNDLIPGDPSSPGLTVPPDVFDSHLAYLKEQGYTTVGLDDLYKAFYLGLSLPEKSIVITFDDGCRDNYQFAYPILRKYGFRATFFVPSNYLDNGQNYLTAGQAKEMSDAGMDIESHTVGHVDLSALTGDALFRELTESKLSLEKLTGREVFFIAYPFGRYNQEVIEDTKKAGYLMGVTTERGNIQSFGSPYELKRLYIGPGLSVSSFAKLLTQ